MFGLTQGLYLFMNILFYQYMGLNFVRGRT